MADITDEQIRRLFVEHGHIYAGWLELGRAILALQPSASAEPVDAARVRDEALREAVQLYESEDVLAPVGNSAWGEAYQEGWIAGAQAYREAIRALIGTGGKLDQSGDDHG